MNEEPREETDTLDVDSCDTLDEHIRERSTHDLSSDERTYRADLDAEVRTVRP